MICISLFWSGHTPRLVRPSVKIITPLTGIQNDIESLCAEVDSGYFIVTSSRVANSHNSSQEYVVFNTSTYTSASFPCKMTKGGGVGYT